MLFFSKNIFDKNDRHCSVPLRIWTLALAAAALGLVACQPQGQGQDQQAAVDTPAVQATLDSLRAAYVEAYNAGDFEKTAKVSHSEMIYSPPGHPPIRGRDSVTAHEKKTRPPGATIDLKPIDTRILSSEWVYEFGTATVTFTPEGADRSRSAESTYLAIFRKTPDGWKTYRETISTNGSSQ